MWNFCRNFNEISCRNFQKSGVFSPKNHHFLQQKASKIFILFFSCKTLIFYEITVIFASPWEFFSKIDFFGNFGFESKAIDCWQMMFVVNIFAWKQQTNFQNFHFDRIMWSKCIGPIHSNWFRPDFSLDYRQRSLIMSFFKAWKPPDILSDMSACFLIHFLRCYINSFFVISQVLTENLKFLSWIFACTDAYTSVFRCEIGN